MAESRQLEAQLRETAEKLLREKNVSLFVGYEKASLPFRTTPLLLTKTEEAPRLVWNPFCNANLSVYLPRLFLAPADARAAKAAPAPPRVGVVLKGCDSRALVQQIFKISRVGTMWYGGTLEARSTAMRLSSVSIRVA